MIHFTLMPDGKAKLNLLYRVDRELFFKYKTICDENHARYNAEAGSQTTTIDNVPVLMELLVAAGFKCTLEDTLLKSLQELAGKVYSDTADTDKRMAKMEKKLAKEGKTLFPFQRMGVKWLAPRRRALLADEMGLGKTIQVAMAIPENAPVIVVCPNVVKPVWYRELKKWRPDLRPYILSGRGTFMWPRPGEVYIYNYDILPGSPPDDCPPGTVVIFDEAHALKNPKAKRTKFSRQIKDVVLDLAKVPDEKLKKHKPCRGKVWLTTGSPMLNRPPELWAVLEAAGLGDDAYGNWRNFMRLFKGTPSQYGYDWGLPEAEAAPLLKKVCLMRKRADVLPELPVKTYSQDEIDTNDPDLQAQLDEIVEELNDEGLDLEEIELEDLMRQSVIFEKLSKIRAQIAKAKIPALLEFVEQYEENDEPLVVFSAHRAPVDYLAQRPGWISITGDTTMLDRGTIVEDFQAGKYKGIALTIASGGVGITLTHSAHAVFVDLMWTPALNGQAEDRICRIGQDRGCQIHWLLMKHPVELRVHQLLTIKKEIISAGVDAAKTTNEDAVSYNLNLNVLSNENIAVGTPEKNKPIETQALQRLQQTVAKSNGIKVAEENKVPVARDAINPIEKWAKQGLLKLSNNDPDHAREVNGVGFNKFDGTFGHDLAKRVHAGKGLTEKQWKAAVKLLHKYQRQVGAPPAM